MPTYGLYLSTLVHEFIGIYVRKLSKNNKDSIVNVYKNENFNKAVKRFIDSLNCFPYSDETIPTFEECVKSLGLRNKI